MSVWTPTYVDVLSFSVYRTSHLASLEREGEREIEREQERERARERVCASDEYYAYILRPKCVWFCRRMLSQTHPSSEDANTTDPHFPSVLYSYPHDSIYKQREKFTLLIFLHYFEAIGYKLYQFVCIQRPQGHCLVVGAAR